MSTNTTDTRILRQSIILDHPELFGTPPFNVRETCIAFGLECGDGWLPILDDLCTKLSDALKRDPGTQFRFMQVKEKWGALTMYYNGGNDEMRSLLSEAESQAAKTCEYCGGPSEIRNDGGWYTTVCVPCEEARYKARREEFDRRQAEKSKNGS